MYKCEEKMIVPAIKCRHEDAQSNPLPVAAHAFSILVGRSASEITGTLKDAFKSMIAKKLNLSPDQLTMKVLNSADTNMANFSFSVRQSRSPNCDWFV